MHKALIYIGFSTLVFPISNLIAQEGNGSATAINRFPIQAQPAITTIKKPAIIRDGPSKEGAILRRVKMGESLYIVDKNSICDGYIEVIHISSDTSGWIEISALSNKMHNIKQNTTSPFRGEAIGEAIPPEISVSNRSSYNLTLKISENTYLIPANSTHIITQQPGIFTYRASAPGVIPNAGTHDFKLGYKYTWTFWVETH